MDNQEQFKEALGTLLAAAKEHGGVVPEELLSRTFSEWQFTEEQKNLIYSYLELNQIRVEGHEADAESLSYLKGADAQEKKSEKKPAGKKLTGEDSKCYKMYLEELADMEALEEAESERLLELALAGDKAARNRLTEGHLGRVVELAREYAGQGVLMADLIQEGNMALLMAMETFIGGEFGLHLTKEICSALDAAVAEQNGQENTGNYLASQANAMMKATEELVEELGREATLSEVAERMKLSEEMTRDIMKISMDALSVVEANGGGETFGEEGGAR